LLSCLISHTQLPTLARLSSKLYTTMTGESNINEHETTLSTRPPYVNSFSSLLTHTPGSKSNLLVEDALMEETDTSRGHTPLSPIGIRSAPLD